MAVLFWGIGPLLAHLLDGPSALVRALILVMTAGLAWQFVLVLVLVRREQGALRWSVVKDALWLHAPRSPRRGRRSRWALFSDSPVTGYTFLILPIAVQEMVLAVWLLVKGFSPMPDRSRASTAS
jgi:hypothetical protein